MKFIYLQLILLLFFAANYLFLEVPPSYKPDAQKNNRILEEQKLNLDQALN
jgi:hypothetical protein